jgi:monoamine oxidase
MKYDVIIIGAGAAGLMAMRTLVNKGYKVCLLEAASFPGGRIATLRDEGFTEIVEAGAEFIHAGSKMTIDLLKEASIPYIAVEGDMVPVHNGEWQNEDKPDEDWNKFINQLKKQKEDLTVIEFLDKYFSAPEDAQLRDSVQRFAEGFDLADISRASMLSLRNEWKHFDEAQYRIPGGYDKLIHHLVDHCLLPDSIIEYNSFVTKIEYTEGNVKVDTNNGNHYKASKIIVTASLGMLQSGEIIFDPLLTAHDSAIKQIGFGHVIKFLFEFNDPFWKGYHKCPAFLLSDEEIPTWWTQLPAETNLLTGWIGGPEAFTFSGESEKTLMNKALSSLSRIFNKDTEELQKKLVNQKIICWSLDSLAKGGYSYNLLHSEQAKKILSEPVYDTIYFAGEGVYTGESQGTVESALQSGKQVAEKIITSK